MDGGYIGPIANFGPYPWDGKTLQYKRPSRNILNPHYPGLVKKKLDIWAWTFIKTAKGKYELGLLRFWI